LALPWALENSSAAFLVMFLIGGVILGFYALGLAIVGERVGPGDLAAVNGAFIVMYQAGALVGPLICGVAMTERPVQGFVGTVVGLTIISGALVVVFDRWERSRTRAGRAHD
jgi:predicted MFS family arabinose efflux permease